MKVPIFTSYSEADHHKPSCKTGRIAGDFAKKNHNYLYTRSDMSCTQPNPIYQTGIPWSCPARQTSLRLYGTSVSDQNSSPRIYGLQAKFRVDVFPMI